MAARDFGLTGSLTGAEVGCSAVRRFKYLENFLHRDRDRHQQFWSPWKIIEKSKERPVVKLDNYAFENIFRTHPCAKFTTTGQSLADAEGLEGSG